MSIGTFFAHLFGGNAATAIQTAPATTTAAIQAFAGSESSKIVAALATTDIGVAVKADVTAIESSALTGPEKFAKVVTNTTPLLVKYLAGGGVTALESDVLGIAQSLVQTVYNDVASTSFGKVAGDFLKLLGI